MKLTIRDGKQKLTNLLLPFILLLVGLYLVPVQLFDSNLSKIPGDLVDVRFNNYILEHGYLYFNGTIDKYWDAPFMYPFHNVIAFSDNLLGIVPIYSFFRSIGADRETSYQLLYFTLFILNFVCCYYALKKWSGHTILSATGAYVFTFSIFIYGHIYHIQNFPRFIVPLIFYWLWKFLIQKDLKYFLFTMLGIVFQFYCAIYLGFFLVYALICFLISYIVVYRDWEVFTQFKKIKTCIFVFLTLLLSFAILAPLMLPYIHISQQFGMRKFEDVVNTIPTVRSYFFTSKASATWTILSDHAIPFIAEWWCHFLFIGALPWLAIIALPSVFFSKRTEKTNRRFIAFLFFALVLSFIFCLNINGFTLYKYVFLLPGFSSMRAIHRLINTEIMFFVLILVFVFKEMSERMKIMKWIVMSLPLLVVLDNLLDPREINRFEKTESIQQVAKVKQTIKDQLKPDSKAIAYLTDDMDNNHTILQINVMLAAQELNIACVNGYSGACPPSYSDFLNHSDQYALKRWYKFLNINGDHIQNIKGFSTSVQKRTGIHLIAANGKYVCDEPPGSVLIANRNTAELWETFFIDESKKGSVFIQAYDRSFISARINDKGLITATGEYGGGWETFEMVNFDSDSVAFKAANGKYLSLDERSFLLFAKSDTIGKTEKFKIIK